METNWKHIAQGRTDIFGVADVETFIGQRIGEEDVKQREKVTWDRHTSSISATSQCCPQMKRARSLRVSEVPRSKAYYEQVIEGVVMAAASV